ncbi:MAG: hypothetical protein I3270_01310 [Candidatus Moeniiplasma glomeromycotorum]|nr:hypothetical protein [Candidatus Moeniiplasma glomeromycotorum]MCE8162347.1 hypothetical protein [Candidatus Moeniiplasma glomeromycotorum]MCE8166271.1 hypothetical protein [Candidatus Moeniiplasma glomeromycotorum]MCE8166753.1 hypothetical protein [Candidatus Moeniiplasma glomeromycotorum]
MVKNNEWAIPKNIQKPVETVCEVENEYKVPSYEEFMKTYDSDSKVNYDDLGHSDIGDNKGYGPMQRCQLQELQVQRQMSVQEKKLIYGIFCASIERLEKYIEIVYKKELPDWEKRKQIKTNSE